MKKQTGQCEYYALKHYPEIMQGIVEAIITQAGDDYKNHPRCRDVVYDFFIDEWCEDLCNFMGVDAINILNDLEKEVARKGA